MWVDAAVVAAAAAGDAPASDAGEGEDAAPDRPTCARHHRGHRPPRSRPMKTPGCCCGR